MAYDPITGQWREDSTGLPDLGMPAGMGDFTGATTPPPPPPQQINPRPMAGTTPSPQMQMLMHPEQANIEPQPVSPELTPGMVNQEWNKINRPQEWDAGRIASTIASLPVTLPLQLAESVRGLFGGDTIQGWGEQADARYSDPNYSESRAFGVKSVAKEPDYGDRWTGIITGRSQQSAMAGKLMRQEIGRYTKQRSTELKNFKYVGDIYGQAQTLQTNQMKLDFLPEQQKFERNRDVRAGERLELERRSSGATATLAEMRAAKMRGDAETVARVRDALSTRPELADGQHMSELMAIAGNNLGLVKQALEINAAGVNMPSADTGLTRGQATTLQTGQIPAIAEDYVTDRRTADQRAADDAKLAAEIARTQADKDRAEAIAANARADTQATALTGVQGQGLESAYKAREIQGPKPTTSFFGGKNTDEILAYLGQLEAEKSRVMSMFQNRTLSPEGASAIATRSALDDPAIQQMLTSGMMDPDALNYAIGGMHEINRETGEMAPFAPPMPRPTVTPTLPPRSQALPARPAGESPAAVGERKLGELMDRILRPGARPTPMATPTRSVAGPAMSEDQRRTNADKLARFTPRFQAEWQRTHPDKPMRGPLYDAEFKRNAEANGLVVESLQ